MLGNNIYELRKANSMSQEDLAKLLKVSRQAISKWERDESTPDLDKITVLSKVFKITVDDLLAESYDISSYDIPKNGMFSMIDDDSISLVSLGITVITILSSIFILFNITRFINMINSGLMTDLEITGIFSKFISNFNVVLSIMMITNFLVVAASALIFYFYRNDQVNKRVRYFIFFFGLGLVLFGQELIGIVYLFLSVISKEKDSNIAKDKVLIIFGSITVMYIIIGFLFYSIGGYDISNDFVQEMGMLL